MDSNSNAPDEIGAHKNSEESAMSKQRARASNAARLLILQATVPIATNLASSQLEAFANRLADELGRLADQAVRPEDAKIALDAQILLKRNSSVFYRLVAAQINLALSKEVSIFNTKKRAKKEDLYLDNTARTYEQMEERILLRHASQSLDVMSAEALVMLNTLIGRILNRMPIDISQNPFRPELFVNAVYEAWKELDSNSTSHLVILRVLQPHIFIQLTPILDEINRELMAKGIHPDSSHDSDGPTVLQAFLPATSISQNPVMRAKLRKVFSGDIELAPISLEDAPASFLDLNDERAVLDETLEAQTTQDNFDKQVVDQHFFEDLIEMQKTMAFPEVGVETDEAFEAATSSLRAPLETNLRRLLKTRSALKLGVVERNSIELLARIFDYIFADQTLRDDIKALIAQLQIPMLRVALSDIDFFMRESHPARTLMDILGSSGMVLDADKDPLLEKIGDIVERVQSEFNEQIDMFSDVVIDLENFLKEEEQRAQEAISQPVQTALSEEKMRVARELAEHDVAIRVETGEVAGFLENFLQEQWIRILTIAHSVKDEKPHALENALKTMDDLIWSLKPKNSAEERKELIVKLPSMLTLLNAWLNAIRWDEPERVLFFSKLAERHAAMARAPLELSPRRQLEIAVNIAQRASNRRLDRLVHSKQTQLDDEASKQVEELDIGMWLDFTDAFDHVTRYKLAWISPKRTSFIFTNRQGGGAFSISAEELTKRCREGDVTNVVVNSLLDRALGFALRDIPG
ncbi:DUF1631 family protein [Undibacterium cyanobacteriorum]|uniref:DUF1631 family protein n=1 Tax=Undibacterium cyanobacteriorum TaxID=3073561 RepID=A0ABY9RK20_9BURK|nr:DUF1631 family protein [Undibacterium sp. 20NA77.5]WMW81573.1 DUF1631 family protein [Undibacterium sp. 20NA77.5]